MKTETEVMRRNTAKSDDHNNGSFSDSAAIMGGLAQVGRTARVMNVESIQIVNAAKSDQLTITSL